MIDKKKYAELYHTGNKNYHELASMAEKETGEHWDRKKMKSCLRRTLDKLRKNSTKEGETEQKPKVELTERGYRIFYGKGKRNSIQVDEERLQEAFALYCLANMTMNQVCLKMNWTRKEFFAIKTAFVMTKSDLPFTQRQIDDHSPEELAEIVRIQKKRYALQKYEANKYKDIEARVKQMDEADYWLNQIITKVNKIEPDIVCPVKFPQPADEIYKVNTADLHSGLMVSNYFGTYDYDVMFKRLRLLLQDIVSNVPRGARVHVSGLGDMIHGIIHGSTYKYGGWVMDAVFQAVKWYDELLLSLINEGYVISLSMVNGSHSSLMKSKEDRTEEDNFGNLIYNILKWHFSDFDVEFIDKLEGLNYAVIPIFDYDILDMHGDNMGEQQKKIMDRLLSDYSIAEIHQGHIHHLKSEDFGGLKICYNEPICSTDQYAGNKGLNSESGCRIIQYTPLGRGKEWLCRF